MEVGYMTKFTENRRRRDGFIPYGAPATGLRAMGRSFVTEVGDRAEMNRRAADDSGDGPGDSPSASSGVELFDSPEEAALAGWALVHPSAERQVVGVG